MILVPNLTARIANKDGHCQDPWVSFFQQFSQSPSPILDIIVGLSPYAYTVKEPGSIYLANGTVTGITLIRGKHAPLPLDTTSGILIPVCIGDIITVSYSVLPTISFLPNYSNPAIR